MEEDTDRHKIAMTDYLNVAFNVTSNLSPKMFPKRKTSDSSDTNKQDIPEGNPGWNHIEGLV
jgi:hypothetical protein